MKELDFNEEARPAHRAEGGKRGGKSKPSTKREYRYREIEQRLEQLRLERELGCDYF